MPCMRSLHAANALAGCVHGCISVNESSRHAIHGSSWGRIMNYCSLCQAQECLRNPYFRQRVDWQQIHNSVAAISNNTMERSSKPSRSTRKRAKVDYKLLHSPPVVASSSPRRLRKSTNIPARRRRTQQGTVWESYENKISRLLSKYRSGLQIYNIWYTSQEYACYVRVVVILLQQ